MPAQGTSRTGLSHRTGSCCHFACLKLFIDFSSHRVSAMAWSAHSKGLFMKSFDSTAVPTASRFGRWDVGHFSREPVHVAASACVGFLSQSSNSSQHFMTLKPGVQGHLFAQASNFVLYIYTIYGHFWRNQKRHVIVCFWILHMRLSILHNGMLMCQKLNLFYRK